MGVLSKSVGVLADWLEAGYPEEVARRIVSGELPMDEASRMARAAEQGYGDVLYRGHSHTNAPRSDRDMWMTDSPDVAKSYLRGFPMESRMDYYGAVTPLRTNADKDIGLAYVRGDGKRHDRVTSNAKKIPEIQSGFYKGTDDIVEAVKESDKYTGTVFKKIRDEFSTDGSTPYSDVYNILASRPDVNIRHADAAYDPQYTGPNIMGGVLAGGVGLGALSQSEDADAGVATSLVELILKKYGDDIAGATEELVRLGGFPESVANRIATGELPMDEASRVARREAQTDPYTFYHGSGRGDLTELKPAPLYEAPIDAVSLSDDGGIASRYAENAFGYRLPSSGVESPTVYPVRLKSRVAEPGEWFDAVDAANEAARDAVTDTELLREAGIQAVEYPNMMPDMEVSVIDNTVIRSPSAAYDPQYTGPNIMGNATVPALGVLATGTGAALAAPALKSEGLEKATGFLDETIRSARHAAGPLSFLVPYEGISNFAKKWNADEELTWQDYLGLLDF